VVVEVEVVVEVAASTVTALIAVKLDTGRVNVGASVAGVVRNTPATKAMGARNEKVHQASMEGYQQASP
jgi:hypothetical protein